MEMLLNKQELLDLGEDPCGLRVVCHEGRCWITQAGDSRDHILRSGATFTVRAAGRVIVTAVEGCRITLIDDAAKGRLSRPFVAILGY